MEWAQRRQIYYSATFAVVIISIVALLAYIIFHKAPTCFDQKQNGNEIGIDCGGSCARYCSAQVKPLHVVWVKASPFAPGHYDVGAYIENPNVNAGIHGAKYTVRIFGQDNNLVSERNGVVDIIPGAPILVFEGNFSLASEPMDVQIEFNDGDLERWTKARSVASNVLTKNQRLTDTDIAPRLEVTLINTDLVNSAEQITVGAIVYDSTGQPVAVSRTFVDKVEKGGEYQAVFTWPNAFSRVLEGEKFTSRIVIMPSLVFEN